jgi:hypothetical protein
MVRALRLRSFVPNALNAALRMTLIREAKEIPNLTKVPKMHKIGTHKT